MLFRDVGGRVRTAANGFATGIWLRSPTTVSGSDSIEPSHHLPNPEGADRGKEGSAVRGALFHFMLASGIAAALRFLLFPLLSSAMPMEEFGKVGLYLATTPFLALAVGWSMVTPWVIGFHERDERSNRRLLGGMILFTGGSCAVLGPIGWLHHETFAAWIGPGLGPWGVVEAIATASLATLSSAFLELDKIRQESRRYLAASLIQSLLQVGTACAAVLVFDASFAMFVHGYFAGCLLALVFQFLSRLGQGGPLPPDLSSTRALWTRALPLTATSALSLVASLGDRHFVQAASGLASVGVYMMGAKIGEIVQQLVHAPMLARMTPSLLAGRAREPGKFREHYETEFRRLMVLSLLSTAVLSAGLDLVFHLLLPRDYAAGVAIASLFLLSHVLSTLGDGLAMPILVHGRLKTYAGFAAVGALLSLAANGLLTPTFGLLGAACAAVLVQAAGMLQSWLASRALPDHIRLSSPSRILMLCTAGIPALQAMFAILAPHSWLGIGGRTALAIVVFTLLFGKTFRTITESILPLPNRFRRHFPQRG